MKAKFKLVKMLLGHTNTRCRYNWPSGEIIFWVTLFSVVFRFGTKHINAELPTNIRTRV